MAGIRGGEAEGVGKTSVVRRSGSRGIKRSERSGTGFDDRSWGTRRRPRGILHVSTRHKRREIKADVVSRRLPMVSLTLFFSSLLPCLLHVCLYIWSASSSGSNSTPNRHGMLENKLVPALTAQFARYVPPSLSVQWADTCHALAGTMQKEGIDKMWVVVRLLAGMSSGFGLRGTSFFLAKPLFRPTDGMLSVGK